MVWVMARGHYTSHSGRGINDWYVSVCIAQTVSPVVADVEKCQTFHWKTSARIQLHAWANRRPGNAVCQKKALLGSLNITILVFFPYQTNRNMKNNHDGFRQISIWYRFFKKQEWRKYYIYISTPLSSTLRLWHWKLPDFVRDFAISLQVGFADPGA